MEAKWLQLQKRKSTSVTIEGSKIRRIISAITSQGILRIHARTIVQKQLKGKGYMTKCERCRKLDKVTTGSYFDTAIICMNCETLEQKHPEYAKAKQVESEEVRRGNYNYRGIGLPSDWQEFVKLHGTT